MANNITVKDAANANVVLRTTDTGGVHAQHVNLDTRLAGEDQTNDRMRVEAKPADADSVLEFAQNAAVAVGNGTAINMKGYKSLSVGISANNSGTWSIAFEATLDVGSTIWFSIHLQPFDITRQTVSGNALGAYQSGPSQGASASAAAFFYQYFLPVEYANAAFDQIRFRISAMSSVPSGGVTVRTRKHPR